MNFSSVIKSKTKPDYSNQNYTRRHATVIEKGFQTRQYTTILLRYTSTLFNKTVILYFFLTLSTPPLIQRLGRLSPMHTPPYASVSHDSILWHSCCMSSRHTVSKNILSDPFSSQIELYSLLHSGVWVNNCQTGSFTCLFEKN